VLFVYDADVGSYYCVHDHLYSPVALTSWSGTVLERYEYESYTNNISKMTYDHRSGEDLVFKASFFGVVGAERQGQR